MAHAPQEIRTFFVTSVTNRRHAFFKNADAAELLIDTLYFYRGEGRFELHEFVIMPDHLHLIITPEERIPLEKAVQYIKGGYATAARRELGLSTSKTERMPWKTSSVMEEKLKFVLEYLEQEWSMSELCERYGIAR
jgi:REP element-mobilizing transposase RayT